MRWCICSRSPGGWASSWTLDEFDRISRRTPYIVNVKPSGEYLMEDFFAAGGVPAVMSEILPLLHGDALTVTGKTIAENVAERECYRSRSDPHARSTPLHAEGGTVDAHGNLAPDGAVIKQTAASPDLLQHRGPAYVFENHAQMHAEIDQRRSAGDARYRAGDEELRAEGRVRAFPNGGRSRCRASC